MNVDRLPIDFRTAENQLTDIGASGLSAIYRMQALQVLLSAVTSDRTTADWLNYRQEKTNFKSNITKKEILASKIRELTNYSLKYQDDLVDPYSVFWALRYHIELSGVLVVCEELRKEKFRGFCLHNDNIPIIFINTSNQHYRTRIFTLIHELCHVLIGKTGIVDIFNFRNRIERFCNITTASSLAPEKAFKKIFYSIDYDNISENPLKLVNLISESVPISKFSIAIRIEELGLIKDFASKWLSSLRHKKADYSIPEFYSKEFDPTDEEIISITSFDVDEYDEDNEDEMFFRRTSASYQVSRLGFATLDLLNRAVKENIISKFDAGNFARFRPAIFEDIISSYNRKLQEVRNNVRRTSR